MQLLATHDDAIDDALRRELAEVEARFVRELRSDLDCVNDLVQHIERYRGKMLRPTLVLLSAHAAAAAPPDDPTDDPGHDPARDARQTVATVVEMVHMATLVHDDILDEADIRRRGPTVNRLAGNESAVMLGDYLISHAYHLCSSLGESWVSRALAAATNTVCEGELLQLSNRGNWAMGEATYRDIIRRKTASLCGASCRIGARLQGVDDAVVTHLGRFGELVGEAFQIIDDVLDLTGEESRVGKTLGRDLDKGKLTLPLLRMLDTLDPDDRRHAEQLLTRLTGDNRPASPPDAADPVHRNGHGDAALDEVGRLLRRSGAIAASSDEARELVERAKACLCEVAPDSPARRTLLTMADRIIDRRA